MQHHDVIIVGGGPAGAAAAYELARRGRKTLLLEKKKLPRYKTCGGGLSAKARKLLTGIDLEDLFLDETTKVVFTYRFRDPLVVEFEDPLIYMVMRDSFDQRLLEHAAMAGTTVLDGTAVSAIEIDSKNVRVHTQQETYSGDLLVLADGAHSSARNQLFPSLDFTTGLAIEAEVETPEEVLGQYRGSVLLNHGSIPNGYGWVFPKRKHLSVGTGSFVPGIKGLDSSLNKMESRLKFDHHLELQRKAHPIPVLISKNPVWHRERAVISGDAGGLIDPFCGEGIFYAVRSGQLAAAAVDASISGREELAAYSEEVKVELWSELRIAAKIARIIYAFPGLIHKMVHQNPEVANMLLRVVFGDLTYHNLLGYLKERYSIFR